MCMVEYFWGYRERFLAANIFFKSSSIINVWESPRYASTKMLHAIKYTLTFLNPFKGDNDGRVHSFISPTCWIQGLYIYRELRKRFDLVAYYGIPKAKDGIFQGILCRTEKNQHIRCKPMERTYYLQVPIL